MSENLGGLLWGSLARGATGEGLSARRVSFVQCRMLESWWLAQNPRGVFALSLEVRAQDPRCRGEVPRSRNRAALLLFLKTEEPSVSLRASMLRHIVIILPQGLRRWPRWSALRRPWSPKLEQLDLLELHRHLGAAQGLVPT